MWTTGGLGKVSENIRTSAKGSPDYFELGQHKLQSEKECSKLMNQKKQDKFQWLQNMQIILNI
jgi:hypothetical protein